MPRESVLAIGTDSIGIDAAEIRPKNVDHLVNFFAPHPLSPLLLQTKGELPFDWTVDRAVEALFRVFLTPNCVHFS
jgi:hypothetical protein